MSNLSSPLRVTEIKRRMVSSFVSLTARQVLLRAISFISINVILAKVLPVETLGIFNIATSIITFFAYFSDIGLAASLIQKKEEISESDIKTTFTIQLIIVGFLSLVIIIASPLLGDFYKLGDTGVWLVRVLGLSFFLTSLKVVPSVILERQLAFKTLVTIEIVETLIFNSSLVILSLLSFGLWSFSIAALLRGILGVILIYILVPIKINFGIEKVAAWKLLSFGIPYQTNSLLALAKDRLVPLVVAKMVGPQGVGFITWSQSLSYLPLEIMSIIIRITFPAFSRLQQDKESLQKAVEKSLFVTALSVYPILFGIGALLPSLVSYVVSSKWQPAVLSFYLFAFSAYWAVISTTFTNTINAIGKIKITLKLMVFWTVLTWLVTPLLVYIYGFMGVAITSFLISFTSVFTIIIIKRELTINVLNSVLLPTIASAIMAVSVFIFSSFFVRNTLTLLVAVALGAVVYLLIIFFFAKDKVLADLKSLKND